MAISDIISAMYDHVGEIYDTLELGGDTTQNKNIVNINTEIKREYKNFLAHGTDVLWNNWEKVSGSGETLTLNNTMEGKMKVDLKGNTQQGNLPSGYTQVEYIESSGTQYIDTGYTPVQNDNFEFNNVSVTSGAIFSAGGGTYQLVLISYGEKSYFKYFASGNALAISYNFNNTNIEINNGEIYLDDVSMGTSTYGGTVNSSLLIGKRFGESNYLIGKVGEIKITNGTTLKRHFIPCYRNSDNVIGMYDLVSDTFYTNSGTGTFTYGSVAPTPDTPIDIQVVSGDNTIKVEGKNLIDCVIVNDTSSEINTTKTVDVPLKAGTYTVRFIGKVSGEQISSGLMSGSTYITSLNWYDLAKTFTLTEDTTITKVYTQVPANRTFYVQLEKGNTASTTYTPYETPQTYPISLGNIELCKIGTYQDSIVKDNGKWYLNKQIGKVVLDGSENWNTWTTTTTNTRGVYSYINLTTVANGFCNYFPYSTTNPYTANDTLRFYFQTSGQKYIAFRIPLMEVADWKEWLSNHNTTVYYVLQTPTYTEITDTTLLSQLEALAYSYDGTTNISQENDDLASELDVVALQEM